MSQRTLYLAAYDVRSLQRLRQCRRILRDYSSGGQKSVFECYLTPAEAKTLLARVASCVRHERDMNAAQNILAVGHGRTAVGIPVL